MFCGTNKCSLTVPYNDPNNLNPLIEQTSKLITEKEKTPKLEVKPTAPQEQLQPSSIIEESEVGGSNSCVSSCGGETTPVKEIDGADILNDPIVQRATELFEATKRTVQSKI